jgi:hypothetical protein
MGALRSSGEPEPIKGRSDASGNADRLRERCKLCGSPLLALVRDGRYFT